MPGQETRVLKYGGTLLADATGRVSVAGEIEQIRQLGIRVVVVVSAMGRMGDPCATDRQ